MISSSLSSRPTLTRWNQLWSALGVAPPSEEVVEELVASYSAPDRFYHTLQHLEACLLWLDRVRGLCRRPDEVELALWFHDAVYDTRRSDNEEKSAEWMERVAREQGLPEQIVERVRAFILATRHGTGAVAHDAALIADIDLAILGAAPEQFEHYEQSVRAEYAWVEEKEFCTGRLAVLRSFLARRSIYSTRYFRDRCEALARHNIAQSVASLVSLANRSGR